METKFIEPFFCMRPYSEPPRTFSQTFLGTPATCQQRILQFSRNLPGWNSLKNLSKTFLEHFPFTTFCRTLPKDFSGTFQKNQLPRTPFLWKPNEPRPEPAPESALDCLSCHSILLSLTRQDIGPNTFPQKTESLMMLETSWRLLFNLLKAFEDLGSLYSAFFLQSRGWHQRVKEQQSHLSKCSADKYLCYLPVKFDEKVWLLLTPAKLKLRKSMRKSQQFQMSQSNEDSTHSSEAMLQWSQCETCSQQILTKWTGQPEVCIWKTLRFWQAQKVQRIYHWQFSTCLWELLCQIPSATPAGTADGCPAVLQSTKYFCISNQPLAPSSHKKCMKKNQVLQEAEGQVFWVA